MPACSAAHPLNTLESRSRLQAKDYKFYAIGDRFRSLEEVSDGLREAGLESSQLVRDGGRDVCVAQGFGVNRGPATPEADLDDEIPRSSTSLEYRIAATARETMLVVFEQ